MLTDTKIRNAKPKDKSYRLADSGGLCLEVRPTGAKFWRYRYRIGDKENLYALGGYPDVSLQEAREERDKARRHVKRGIHPKDQRDREKAARALENRNSFQVVAEEWIDQRKAKWTPYYLGQVNNMLAADMYPAIGESPMRSITSADVLVIVKRVELRAPSVALLLRQWTSAIFRYAVSTLRADHDPAAALKGALHCPPVKHHQPLDEKGIPIFLDKLETAGGYQTTRIALRLLLLLFVRPVELRAAQWCEFDLDTALWRVPGPRMKMRTEHLVPLSRQAVALLRELYALTGAGRFLFPNYRRPKDHMSATTLNRALERLGYGGQFSAHGFRSTASTALNERGYNPDWVERQLAHSPRDKVRASYNFAQYMPERRQMMQDWSDYVDGLRGEQQT